MGPSVCRDRQNLSGYSKWEAKFFLGYKRGAHGKGGCQRGEQDFFGCAREANSSRHAKGGAEEIDDLP